MKRSLIPWRKREASVQRRSEDPIQDLHRRMDEVFEDVFGSFGLPDLRLGALSSAGPSPSFEVTETDDAVEVHAELPGLDEKDIAVSLDDRVLTVRGEKSEESERKRRSVHYSERRYGAFQRTIPLPADVRTGDVKARFRRGVLTITLPKARLDSSDRRRIAIEAG